MYVRTKQTINSFYSNASVKTRMEPLVKDLFDAESVKRFESIGVQAGNGKLSDKQLGTHWQFRTQKLYLLLNDCH